MGDRYDFLKRGVVGVESPWLLSFEAGIGRISPQTSFEAEAADTRMGPRVFGQMTDISRIAVPVKVEVGVGVRAAPTRWPLQVSLRCRLEVGLVRLHQVVNNIRFLLLKSIFDAINHVDDLLRRPIAFMRDRVTQNIPIPISIFKVL